MSPNQRLDALVNVLIRQNNPLERTTSTPWLAASELADAVGAGVERTTTFRDLQQLVSAGVVQEQGPTRSRTYRIDPTSIPYIAWRVSGSPTSRPRVDYDPKRLADYVPNQTRWLTDEHLERIASVAGEPRKSSPEGADTDVAYRRLLNTLLIDLSYASSRLENVEISWLDTKSLLEVGERPEGLSRRELAIVLNHKEAIQFVSENRGELSLARRTLLDVHKLLSSGLLGNPDDEGRLRRGMVFFAESAYRPISVPSVLAEQFDVFCEKAQQIENPHERAFFTMAMVPYLQPFQDGNKRTSRISMNIPLINAGLAPFSFTEIDRKAYVMGLLAVYEFGRVEMLASEFVEAYVASAARYREMLSMVDAGAEEASIGGQVPPRQRR